MARAVLVAAFITSTLAVAGLAAAGSLSDSYNILSHACMLIADSVRSDLGVVALAAAALAAFIALLTALSAAAQLLRTREALANFKDARADMPPALGTIARRLALADRVDIADFREPLAFCYGLVRPRLMVSTGLVQLLDDDELEAVLRHEAAHLRHFDPLRIVATRSIAFALAFMPFSAGLRDAYLCARELRADRIAVTAMGDALPLASALQRTLASRARSDVRWLAVGALSATDVRIDHLLGRQTPARRLVRGVHPPHAFGFALIVSVSLCVLIATAHASTGVRLCLPC